MKVVCLVPSWTETLIHCGVQIVGRSRFCIHPGDKVASIPVVGGTKQVCWASVGQLAPDLLLLDREENPRIMAEQSPVPWMATHVTCVGDVETELLRLNERLGRPELAALARRWRQVREKLGAQRRQPGWLEMPGVLKWLRRPSAAVDRFIYLIWKDPWRSVGPDTFIGSMLDLLGFGSRMVKPGGKYPSIRLEDYDSARTLLLFASEPYPFSDQQAAIAELPFASALVDGERFGWFGVRALRFLEGQVARTGP